MQPAGTTSNGTTSFEVETDFAAADPRVARSSQPWAGGRNPFGIEDAYKVQSLAAALHMRCGLVPLRWPAKLLARAVFFA